MKIMTYLIAAAAVIFSGLLQSATTSSPLLTPSALADVIDGQDPIVLDIRGAAYAKGHIPGAVSAPYGLFRGPQNNPGQMLDVETLETRFESLGLEIQRPIIIVSDGKSDSDFGGAARVYWTLKSTGFTALSILNGGMAAWQKSGFDISRKATVLDSSELDLQFSDNWTTTTEQIASMAVGDKDALLLDARPESFYLGRQSHRRALKPGTIPGAENHVYSSFFDQGSAAMSPVQDSQSLKSKLGIEEGQQVVSFCNTGHWAAINWFALSELAGIDNVKLYPGSMVEYSNAGLAMENTPGLMKNFLNRITEH